MPEFVLEPNERTTTFRLSLKWLCVVAGILLFASSVFHFLNIFNVFHIHSFILSLYTGVFGLFICLLELRVLSTLGLQSVLDHLPFLQFSRGRALFYIFVGSLTVTENKVSLLSGLVIIVTGMLRLFSTERFDSPKQLTLGGGNGRLSRQHFRASTVVIWTRTTSSKYTTLCNRA
ncbi:hypothetical protein GEMRC1_003267 [Eukaryota sp. GEM-RC1]